MGVLKTKELSPAYKYTQQIFELLFTGCFTFATHIFPFHITAK